MANLAMQAVGCSSTFASGAPLIGARGSPASSSCRRRARTTVSPRSALVLPAGDDCSLSSVDYQDVSSAWISADFLDLRLRSSSLICNEAVQALRKHFQRTSDSRPAPAANAMSTTSSEQDVEQAAPSACQLKPRAAMPSVVVYDEVLFSQLYSSGSTYTTMACFLDESFCN